MMKKYDTIGIDCYECKYMICTGAAPVAFQITLQRIVMIKRYFSQIAVKTQSKRSRKYTLHSHVHARVFLAVLCIFFRHVAKVIANSLFVFEHFLSIYAYPV